MIKKNPTYRLTVYKQDGVILANVEYPLTCRFNSKRGTFSNANRCSIDLYNLSPTTRQAIFKDALVGDLDEGDWKFVKLEAGWNGQLSQIFYGRILQAYSTKDSGAVDVITRIECLPFDIYDCYTSNTFAAGTTYKEAYKTMASDLPNCEIGNIGTLEGTFKSQTTFEGNTLSCLNQLSGGHTYVDNGMLNTLMANEAIEVPVPLITDSAGLLETPKRRGGILTIKTLFEPSLIVGQLLSIQSHIQSEYDGQYKVLGFTHECIMSPTQAGQRISTIELWAIPKLTRSNINLTDEQVTGGAASVNAYKIKGEEKTPIGATTSNQKWIMPCKGYRISSYFGYRPAPKAGASTGHKGIDIACPLGTQVKAMADGTAYVKSDPNGYGKYVGIEHGIINGKRVISRYAHLSQYCISNGQSVKQGQVIALSGNTGNSTGPHLHFEIRIDGVPVNPLAYVEH